jgi:hypothetical protein
MFRRFEHDAVRTAPPRRKDAGAYTRRRFARSIRSGEGAWCSTLADAGGLLRCHFHARCALPNTGEALDFSPRNYGSLCDWVATTTKNPTLHWPADRRCRKTILGRLHELPPRPGSTCRPSRARLSRSRDSVTPS